MKTTFKADLSKALETVQMFEDVDTIAKYGERWGANVK